MAKTKTVNLNKNASALCGENTKVRVRMFGDELQFLPTNRVEGKNLPAGEILVDLRRKKQMTPSLRFNLPAEMSLALGSMFRAEQRKHKWVALVALTDEERAAVLVASGGPKPAGASVSDR